MPLTQGFGGYATRFVDTALGFATGYTYFFKYMIGTANQLSAFALIMRYWVGDNVNPTVLITVTLIAIILINSVNVRTFGEVEFWICLLKVFTMVGIILLLSILAVGGGPSGGRPGFRYWRDTGPIAEFKVKGDIGRFLRVLSVLFLDMVVPCNSEALAFATHVSKSAAASPFVVANKAAGIIGHDYVINSCIVLFVPLVANSDSYIASRGLCSIAADGKVPPFLPAQLGIECLGFLSLSAL
ncbi:unnamed protein product [Clonostachys byssicola]|uniref:Amino acid permease/ SLC12A domain-containing protein n=1 Tax=Clonostachys byssicola TaxID=160290 RepID=A0A9N9Y4P5_9HYPO|nr:unnamed protein product [Clonostachys byssicola]